MDKKEEAIIVLAHYIQILQANNFDQYNVVGEVMDILGLEKQKRTLNKETE